MNRYVLTLIFLFTVSAAFSQQVEKKFLFTLPDTFESERTNLSFDSNGNYCYYRSYPGPAIVITNKGTYGPFKINDDNRPFELVTFCNEEHKGQYIKYRNNSTICGPVDGDVTMAVPRFIKKGMHFGFIVESNDNFDYYINGKLVVTTNSAPCTRDWCAFSNNGHVLYTAKNGQTNYLYVDQKLIDSTLDDYDWMQIDDSGNFCYTLGKHAAEEGMRYSTRFNPLPLYDQKEFSYVTLTRDHRDYYAGTNRDTIYMYDNSDGKTSLIAVNQREWYQTYLNVVTAPGKEEIYFSYKFIDTTLQMYINNKTIELPYKAISWPIIDSSGHYGFFCQRGYYM